MADRPQQIQVHSQDRGRMGGYQQQQQQQKGPSVTKILTVLSLLPVGGTLLLLSGLTLAGSVIGLLVTSPIFLLCSPILVPAAMTVGLAVTGILTSGAFGLTGLSSLGWIMNYVRQAIGGGGGGGGGEGLDQLAKRRMQDMTGYVGQKTKEVGQEIQRKAGREGERT